MTPDTAIVLFKHFSGRFIEIIISVIISSPTDLYLSVDIDQD